MSEKLKILIIGYFIYLPQDLRIFNFYNFIVIYIKLNFIYASNLHYDFILKTCKSE